MVSIAIIPAIKQRPSEGSQAVENVQKGCSEKG
jgi:hypothetical protein